MRSRGAAIDFGTYLRAIPLLLRNPTLLLAPLAASVAVVLLFKLVPGGDGSLAGGVSSGITGLLQQLITGFGLAVAIIGADAAWRRGRAPFDEAWETARRKVGDIVWAVFGFNFVLYVATLLGGFVGFFGTIVMAFLATTFFIYTLPAATIGGIPGGAALNVSLERARANLPATIVLTIVYVFVQFGVPYFIELSALPYLIAAAPALASSTIAFALLNAVISAILAAYLALVLAKTYVDVSYGRFR